MQVINVELTNDQTEYLEQISRICKKNTSDFIREALVCLLPLNEYIELKKNIVVLQNEKDFDHKTEAIHDLEQQLKNINVSASNRLKRIGIL